ncbi:MAG: FAD-dependent oxidoreductase [Chloroflexi bacterium]|nr:FAD-dependent oxidoreductase [Chloroflexota bacterium]
MPENSRHTVLICQGTGCTSAKSPQIQVSLEAEIRALGLPAQVKFTGCHGFCQRGPIAIVEPEGVFYTHVKPEDARDIARSHLKEGKVVERLLYPDPQTGERIPHYKDVIFYKEQNRVVLKNCGHINPESLDDALEVGVYSGLKKALQMSPEQVIEEVKKSGLRGRGGAGFPTWQKWSFCRAAPGQNKYMIVNADEGDPGAFMDRSILEADPHSCIEGMTVGAYAIGANHGYMYVRAEYPLAIVRVRKALAQAEERGFLGDNILGSGFSFHVQLKEGAGAFVCGEETALIASIEGLRGMPRPRPPFPANSGVWASPSNINNVKTLTSAARILSMGADWFAGIGTADSKGTVIFSLTGKVANCGLVEVPMGTPLRKIIYEIGGGIPNQKRFKAVQTGGPSGGCLPASMLDTPVDFGTLAQVGSILGSGGMVVADEDTCIVDLARFFLTFTQAESCGKCIPCRVGTRQMLNLMTRITQGEGQRGDVEKLISLANTVRSGSLCGLGQTCPNPILTTTRYFLDEYKAHIEKKKCPAVVCRDIIIAPCRHTCPAQINVPRYIREIQKGDYDTALAVIRERVPFPAILGYVCFHPCEAKCRRKDVDEPIAICSLKRFAADHATDKWKDRAAMKPPTGKRVAVVGAGPAGLTAAYYLARLGHKVTVLEALPQAGGMMRVGIPRYRLPAEVLDKEIGEITALGVELKTNTRVQSADKLFAEGYAAVYLATGAHLGTKMRVKGEDGPGVLDCVTFLREASSGQKFNLGIRVVVVGGGNSAIDAARTALRLGAKEVTIVYRRTRKEMPATHEEIEEALHEGAKLEVLANPTQVIRDSGHLKLECVRMRLGAPDDSGRPRPEPMPGSEYVMEVDSVIAAIGQMPEDLAEMGIKVGRGNQVEVNEDTMATSRPGVFAGGDVVLGPSSVIESIAQGREAAMAVDRYLGGKGDIAETFALPEEIVPAEVAEGGAARARMPAMPPAQRQGSFSLVDLGFTAEQALAECRRCLRCDLEE